jgi:hypothetical protein
MDFQEQRNRLMKRSLFGGLLALGLALTATPAQAGLCFDYSVCRHISLVYTGRTRCLTYNSCSNPVPCPTGCCNLGYGCGNGPALWDGMAAYGGHAYGPAAYPAPVAAAPAATTAPANTSPPFQAPQPTPANKKSTTGLQQAAYYYYAQPSQAGYGYSAGYNYYGAGYSYYGYDYAQAPNYWY